MAFVSINVVVLTQGNTAAGIDQSKPSITLQPTVQLQQKNINATRGMLWWPGGGNCLLRSFLNYLYSDYVCPYLHVLDIGSLQSFF